MMTASSDTATATDAERMMDFVIDWQKAGFGGLVWMSPVWVRAMSDITTEVSEFLSGRIKEDIRIQQEIMECRDPVELREIQGRFLKTAFDQYSAETGRLIRLQREALDELTGWSSGS